MPLKNYYGKQNYIERIEDSCIPCTEIGEKTLQH